MNFSECNLGFRYQNEDVLVFFGKANCSFADVQAEFPTFEFYRIKQTHSDIVIQGSPQVAEADAHWCNQTNKALVILTADCTPILIHNSGLHSISAVHAGWRGVQQEILLKTLKLISSQNADASAFEIWIGPHILQKSFAVDLDVLHKLLDSYKGDNKNSVYYEQNSKFYVNLQDILQSQINKALPDFSKLNELKIDTLTDSRFNSYRRDKNLSGRNISFIARL